MREFTLNENQISILRHVCSKRYHLLSGVFIALPAFLSYALYRHNYYDEIKNTTVTITNSIITLGIVSSLILIYFKKVLPIKKDMKFKQGVYDEKIIVNKSVFEHVGKYFLFFEDIKLPNKEVSKIEYENFNIGDTYAIPMGKYSKLILDDYMNFNLM